MNEKMCSVSLFENLSASLDKFIKSYSSNDLTSHEKPYFQRLQIVSDELKVFLKDKQAVEKFTFDNYDIFILRIEAALPPSVTKTTKSDGVFGLGASSTTEQMASPLGNALSRLLTKLEKSLEEEKRKVVQEQKEAKEKSSRAEKTVRDLEKTSYVAPQKDFFSSSSSSSSSLSSYSGLSSGMSMEVMQQQLMRLAL